MGKSEIVIFIVLVNIILLVFIAGIVIFVLQYRKRKILHEREKNAIEETHKAQLLNAQVEIQKQTMQFIGREIHDSVAQKLTLASIYTQKIEFENKYPTLLEKLHDISSLLNESLAELRSLSKNLTDSKLQHASFEQLLRQECDQVNATGVCCAQLDIAVSSAINIAIKSFLLRIVQEFVQNSLKHAECKTIGITVEDNPDGLFLELEDDGVGFDIAANLSGGIGITNMKRRVQLAGGKYNLVSAKGQGTRLEIFMPLAQVNA